MLQWILTIIIVLAATAYAVYKIIRRFKAPVRRKEPDCNGCSADCGDCPLASEILKQNKIPRHNSGQTSPSNQS